MTPKIEAALKRAHARLADEMRADISMTAHLVYLVLEEFGLVPSDKKTQARPIFRFGSGTPRTAELEEDARACGLLPDADQVRGLSFDGTERRREPDTIASGQSAVDRLRRLDAMAYPSTPEEIIGNTTLKFRGCGCQSSAEHKQFTKSITVAGLTVKEFERLTAVAASIPGCRLVVGGEPDA